jgi:hypothetical protein
MLWTNSAGKQYYTDDTPRKESTKRDQPDSLRLYNQLKPRLFDAIKEYVGTDRDRAHEVMTHLRTQFSILIYDKDSAFRAHAMADEAVASRGLEVGPVEEEE